MFNQKKYLMDYDLFQCVAMLPYLYRIVANATDEEYALEYSETALKTVIIKTF